MDTELFKNVTLEADKIIEKDISTTSGLLAQSEELRKQFDDFKVKVLIVGPFSAGKTALLNRFLNVDTFVENITPETAIATEIAFGTEEKVKMVKTDGSVENCSILDVDSHDPRNYKKYCYFLRNDMLRDLPDYILVDMPGFDSGVEAHNKALMQYLDEGAAYIMVINCESGCVTQSAAEFLQEIQNYSRHIRFVLTKCDKRTPEDVNDVKVQIEQDLESILGEKVEVLTTSAVNDEELPEKMKGIVDSLVPQELFEGKFKDPVAAYLDRAINGIKIVQSSLNLDTKAIDREIENSQKGLESLKQQLERKRRQVQSSFAKNARTAVISEVRGALENNASSLARAAASGNGEEFQRKVLSIIRPAMMNATKDKVQDMADDILGQLELDVVGSELKPGSLETIGDMQHQAEDFVSALKNLPVEKMVKEFSKSKALYKVIATTAAVLTNVIAPVLELVIIFLPDILSAFFKSRQMAQIEESVENEIIPKICHQLEGPVLEAMETVESDVLENLEKEFEGSMNTQIEGLRALQAKKEKEQADYNEKSSLLEKDIDRLVGLKNQILNVGKAE